MKNIDLFNKLISNTESVRSRIHDNFISFKYMNMGVNFAQEYIRLARGITFDLNTKDVVLACFPKFFNYKQLDQYQEFNNFYTKDFVKQFSDFDLNKIDSIEFSEKIDGSLILISEYKNQIIIGTTAGINPIVIKQVEPFINTELKNVLHKYKGYTLAFEFIDLNMAIVLQYKKSELVFLNAISNANLKVVNSELRNQIANELSSYRKPQRFKFNKDELFCFLKNKTEFEGFVFENEFGNMIKIKTEDYFQKHILYSTVRSIRNKTKRNIRYVKTLWDNQELDDFVANLNQKENNILWINDFIKVYTNILDLEYKARLEFKNTFNLNVQKFLEESEFDRPIKSLAINDNMMKKENIYLRILYSKLLC